MAVFQRRLHRSLPCNSIFSPEAPRTMQMEEYLSWLAKQVEKSILRKASWHHDTMKAPTSMPAKYVSEPPLLTISTHLYCRKRTNSNSGNQHSVHFISPPFSQCLAHSRPSIFTTSVINIRTLNHK